MKTLMLAGAMALAGTVAMAQPAAPAAGAAPAGPPRTPPPPPARGPAMDLALEAAQTAVSTCAGNGYKVSAVVVNSAGEPRLVLMADGAPDMTSTIGTRKAYTAVMLKGRTMPLGERIKTDTALDARIKGDPKMITWGGGQPLMAGGEVVGAIGVSGAPGGDKDDACTMAAVNKIKDRLQ